jgi:hypothetical protein
MTSHDHRPQEALSMRVATLPLLHMRWGRGGRSGGSAQVGRGYVIATGKPPQTAIEACNS